ncbi:hypothetical protein NIES4072_35430 [Nostoc commune NIES-4072]|uniref:Uncharacterized protein n=1 Tax=Nostoc commune NIES-4072 TaxID=2005467 RepID=A0A2R5FW34_NOSCO|nr:hypothetical protein NIES4070_55360 [Nostoc commune HK-02]GBG19874.1 hypothetical protein NIES4072_35430 [Nostoc commune NIES-4072]
MTSYPWTDYVHAGNISESVLEADSLFFGNKTIKFDAIAFW